MTWAWKPDPKPYSLVKKHRVVITIPRPVFVRVYEESGCKSNYKGKEEGGGGRQNTHKISKRVLALMMKGLEYEKIEGTLAPKAAPVIVKEAFTPSAPINVGAPVAISDVLYCHERPMVDYGTFWYCMVGNEKVLK